MSGTEPIEQESLGTREEFMAELREITQEQAPKLFALCEEIGDRDDGYVRYWGMSFDDCAEIVSTSGTLRGSFGSPESAHHRLSRKRNLHLMWV